MSKKERKAALTKHLQVLEKAECENLYLGFQMYSLFFPHKLDRNKLENSDMEDIQKNLPKLKQLKRLWIFFGY